MTDSERLATIREYIDGVMKGAREQYHEITSVGSIEDTTASLTLIRICTDLISLFGEEPEMLEPEGMLGDDRPFTR